MSALGDPADPPPMAKAYDEHAQTLPPPEPKPTLRMSAEQQSELNDLLAKHEAGRDDKVIGALDRMVGALMARADQTDAKIDLLRSDVRTWLFGADEIRPGIAQDLELARQGIDSALAAVAKATPRLDKIEQRIEATLRVAKGAYNVALHGEDGIDDDERKAIAAIG